jgi:phosphohistidine swiveling domain-containing protein
MTFKHIVTRHYVPLMINLIVKGLGNPANYEHLLSLPGFSLKHCSYKGNVYWDDALMKEYCARSMAEEEKNPGFIMKVFEHIYVHGERLRKLSEEIKHADFSNKKLPELVERYKEFAEEYSPFTVALVAFLLQLPIEAQLRECLKGRKNIDEDLAVLTFPEKENIYSIENEALLAIAAEIQKQSITDLAKLPAALQKKVDKHADEYGWINTRGGVSGPWTPDDIKNRIKDLLSEDCAKKLKEIKQAKKEHQKQSAALLKELGSDKKLQHLVPIARELVYFRTYRTDYLTMTLANVWPLLEAIGKHLGRTLQDMLYYTTDDVLEQKRVPAEELARRRKDFIFLLLEPHKIIFSSDPAEIKELVKKHLPAAADLGSEVKGTIAFRGKVAGRVALLVTTKDLPKVKTGDILVTAMTFPNFIPAMQRAAAFVTDEGGITCHAAIVSREMKKPCIIGTKNATRVFKDGDIVEVDADKGVVRKIK